MCIHRLRDNRFAGILRDTHGIHGVQQGRAKVAVFKHLAHGAFFDLCVVEFQEEWRGACSCVPVAGHDFEHGLGLIDDTWPQPYPVQHPNRSERQRIGAPVKARLGTALAWQGIDHGNPEAAFRQCQGKRWAVQSTTNDQDISIICHMRRYGAAMRASPCVILIIPISYCCKYSGTTRTNRKTGGLMHDWLTKGALAQGCAIERGALCPMALTEAYLDAIRAHPVAQRVYATVTDKRALLEAMSARSRARAGLRRGPLDGVALSWKDLFDSAGTTTEAGSTLLKGRIPLRDAQVLRVARQAGTICLGKTHMTEFAYSGLGLNPVTSTPPCINDADAVPGGSSSGAAASVAFGLAALGVGSDTGGSVRIPAAWNDLVGLKTTHGRLPMDGVVPLARRFDTLGPLARSVEDCAAFLATLEGRRPPDLRGASLTGRRLLILGGAPFADIRPEPATAFEDAVSRLARAGAVLTRSEFSAMDEVLALSSIIYTPEAWAEWRDLIETRPDAMFPPILARFRSGAEHSAADYIAAWNRLTQLRARFIAQIAEYDAVILPTAPNMPPNAERLQADDAYYTTENLLTLRNTRIGNMLGLCALTVPTRTPSAGISFMAGPMEEDRLLRLGAAAEPVVRG